MSVPYVYPRTTFTGSYGDVATGAWYPAQAILEQGYVTLWIWTANDWAQLFSVPAQQVQVKSAAQRITLVAQGRSYPILADPSAISRGNAFTAAGIVSEIRDRPASGLVADAGRVVNQVSAAQAFQQSGGPEFIAGVNAAGARTSRLGYGPIWAIGCGTGLIVVVLVTVVTALALGM